MNIKTYFIYVLYVQHIFYKSNSQRRNTFGLYKTFSEQKCDNSEKLLRSSNKIQIS